VTQASRLVGQEPNSSFSSLLSSTSRSLGFCLGCFLLPCPFCRLPLPLPLFLGRFVLVLGRLVLVLNLVCFLNPTVEASSSKDDSVVAKVVVGLLVLAWVRWALVGLGRGLLVGLAGRPFGWFGGLAGLKRGGGRIVGGGGEGRDGAGGREGRGLLLGDERTGARAKLGITMVCPPMVMVTGRMVGSLSVGRTGTRKLVGLVAVGLVAVGLVVVGVAVVGVAVVVGRCAVVTAWDWFLTTAPPPLPSRWPETRFFLCRLRGSNRGLPPPPLTSTSSLLPPSFTNSSTSMGGPRVKCEV